jgi:hypothetical protein
MKDNLVKEGNLINFSKRQKAAAIIAEIKRYQSQPYNLLVVEPIRAFVEESLMLEKTSDYFWELSLQREPKERDDEKMARLLQESGFVSRQTAIRSANLKLMLIAVVVLVSGYVRWNCGSCLQYTIHVPMSLSTVYCVG